MFESVPIQPSRRQRLRRDTLKSWFLLGLALLVWALVSIKERGSFGELSQHQRRVYSADRVVPPWEEADKQASERATAEED